MKQHFASYNSNAATVGRTGVVRLHVELCEVLQSPTSINPTANGCYWGP